MRVVEAAVMRNRRARVGVRVGWLFVVDDFLL